MYSFKILFKLIFFFSNNELLSLYIKGIYNIQKEINAVFFCIFM